jgi:spermidine/putrescine transport system ATP-binding protein
MSSQHVLLELKNIAKSFGAVHVLEDINLAVRDGEFITILGPSGSGKTTILRLIGGFASPSEGVITLDGADISGLPINRRPFNTVFQDYALFPHMTVTDNVGYGLKVRGLNKAEISRRVGAALDLVQLGDLGRRYPAQLSGGQKQRVALARAIICEPRLILLDEPLAALDVDLRRQMQAFLKNIQREIRTTFLFVTHDQEEAIAMADRICVMNSGRVLQLGTPLDVYYRPRTEFVARFFGDNNLIEGILGPPDDGSSAGRRRLKTALGDFLCATDGQPEMAGLAEGSRALATIRPENLELGGAAGADNALEGRIKAVEFAGATTMATVEIAARSEGPVDLRLKLASRSDGAPVKPGEVVSLRWRAEDCRLVST